MKKIFKLLVLIASLISMTSCAKRTTSLTFVELIEKLNNKETFTFVITQNNCSACKDYKPILQEYMKETKQDLYEINWDELESYDKLSLAARIHNYFGEDYYTQNGIDSFHILTPTTIQIVEGVFKYGYTEIITIEQLNSLINDNIVELRNYYAYTKKTGSNESFKICFYTQKEQLNKYIEQAEISNYILYTLKIDKLNENNYNNLLSRINYFFNSTKETKLLDSLEEHFQLTYNEGTIISYLPIS